MDMCVRVRRGLVLAGLLLGVGFVGLPAGAAYAAPPAEAGASASTIVVQGNRRVEADTVRSYFKVGPGERLDAAKIDAGLKALYATGLFEDVHISQAGGHIVVTVVESPVINRLAFEGNHRMKDEQLKEEIQSKARDSLSRAKVQADTQRIVEVYHRNGRFDVTVEPKIIERPNNRVDLIFEINEGEKTGVKSIIFVGNKAYSAWRLKEVIKTAESNFLSFLQTTDVYDPDRIEADRDLIRRFYLKHGFADVQVVSAVGEYDPAKKGFIITFTIEEGPVYHFGVIDVQSNVRAIDSQSLRSVLRMRRRRLQRRGDRKDGRGRHHRGGAARLSVRHRAPARRPQSADPHHQRLLRRRRGHARLYRAHQHPRQYPHPRLRDPARVRHRRRRSVQPRADRSRRTAAQESRTSSRR